MNRQNVIRNITAVIESFIPGIDPDPATFLDRMYTHSSSRILEYWIEYDKSMVKWLYRLIHNPYRNVELTWYLPPHCLLLGFDFLDGHLMAYVAKYHGRYYDEDWLSIEEVPDDILNKAWLLCEQWINRPRESFERQYLRQLEKDGG